MINFYLRLSAAMAVILFFGLTGCVHYMNPQPGTVAAAQFRMPLPESGNGRSVWKGKHLDIAYAIDQKGEQAKLSGEVRIHENLLMSFSKLTRLRVKAHFLDDHGTVLTSVGITPLYSTYAEVTEPLEFQTYTVIPPEAVSIVFSYSGLLTGQFNEPSAGWDIDFSPF
jgi:hypothetical protein